MQQLSTSNTINATRVSNSWAGSASVGDGQAEQWRAQSSDVIVNTHDKTEWPSIRHDGSVSSSSAISSLPLDSNSVISQSTATSVITSSSNQHVDSVSSAIHTSGSVWGSGEPILSNSSLGLSTLNSTLWNQRNSIDGTASTWSTDKSVNTSFANWQNADPMQTQKSSMANLSSNSGGPVSSYWNNSISNTVIESSAPVGSTASFSANSNSSWNAPLSAQGTGWGSPNPGPVNTSGSTGTEGWQQTNHVVSTSSWSTSHGNSQVGGRSAAQSSLSDPGSDAGSTDWSSKKMSSPCNVNEAACQNAWDIQTTKWPTAANTAVSPSWKEGSRVPSKPPSITQENHSSGWVGQPQALWSDKAQEGLPGQKSSFISGHESDHSSNTEEDEAIIEAINTNENWGKKPIRQDTSWSMEETAPPNPQPRRGSTSDSESSGSSGTTQWKANNNGTAIWESVAKEPNESRFPRRSESLPPIEPNTADNDNGHWNGPPANKGWANNQTHQQQPPIAHQHHQVQPVATPENPCFNPRPPQNWIGRNEKQFALQYPRGVPSAPTPAPAVKVYQEFEGSRSAEVRLPANGLGRNNGKDGYGSDSSSGGGKEDNIWDPNGTNAWENPGERRVETGVWGESRPRNEGTAACDVDNGTAFWGDPGSHRQPIKKWEEDEIPPKPITGNSENRWGPTVSSTWKDQVASKPENVGSWSDSSSSWQESHNRSRPSPAASWAPDRSRHQNIRNRDPPMMRSKLIQQLVERGFKKDDALNALISCNMDMEQAIVSLSRKAGCRHEDARVGRLPRNVPSNAPANIMPPRHNQPPPPRSNIQQTAVQPFVQKLQHAVQGGLISPALLQQNLPPQMLVQLQQLLELHTIYQKLIQQQQNAMRGPPNSQLNEINIMIQHIKSQMGTTQNQIQKDQLTLARSGQPTHRPNNATKDLGGSLADLELEPTGSISRLPSWMPKLPSPEKESPNKYLWSQSTTSGQDWPMSMSSNVTAVESNAPVEKLSGIEEFVPGKPWQGTSQRNPDNDPYMTPGNSIRPALSISLPIVKDDRASRNSSPQEDLRGGSWTADISIQHNPWQQATRPPPGLTGKTAVSRSHSWNPSERSSSWSSPSKYLILKNISSKSNSPALRNLCRTGTAVPNIYFNQESGQAIIAYANADEAANAKKELHNHCLDGQPIIAECIAEDEAQAIIQGHSSAPDVSKNATHALGASSPWPSSVSSADANFQRSLSQLGSRADASQWNGTITTSSSSSMWGGDGLWSGHSTLDETNLLSSPNLLGGQSF